MVIPHHSLQHRQLLLFAIREQACECASLLLILEVHKMSPRICHSSSKNCETLDFNLLPYSEFCVPSLHYQ